MTELPELPDSLIELWCYNNNLSELPELPISLKELWCGSNKLTELPELPDSLIKLACCYNNIKYLSPNNCQVMKKCVWINVLNNLFSAGFSDDDDFKEYLMNL